MKYADMVALAMGVAGTMQDATGDPGARDGAEPTAAAPVRGLPHARGRSFATLDAYLAFLRDHAAPMDLPWYREVEPGVFRRESNLRNGTPPPVFTREALERRFGFRK